MKDVKDVVYRCSESSKTVPQIERKHLYDLGFCKKAYDLYMKCLLSNNISSAHSKNLYVFSSS